MSQASVKQNFSVGLIMFILILISLPWIHLNDFMDSALTPKFVALSIFFILSLIISLVKKNNNFFNLTISGFFLGLFVCWQLLSIFWAWNFSEALFVSFTSLLLFCSFYIAQIVLNENEKNESYIYYAASIGAVVLCVFGWYEFLSISDFSKQSSVYDVKGFSAHKNLFILLLFLHLPLTIIASLRVKNALKYVLYVCIVLIILLMFSLLARAFLLGFIATLIVGVTLYFLSKEKTEKSIPWKPVLIGGALLLGGLWAVYSFQADVSLLKRYNIANFAKSRNAKERLALWSNSVELIKDKPILGYGAGNWDIFYASKGIGDITRLSDEKKTVSRPHNDYIWITTETGLVGIFLYFLMIGLVFFIAVKCIFKTQDQERKNNLIVLLAFLTGYLIIAFFDFPKERIELNFLLGLILSLIVYNTYKINPEQFTYKIDGVKLKSINVALLLSMLFLVYFAWNRYNGEQLLKKVIALSNAGKNKAITKLYPESHNKFYTITPNEMTLPYYFCFSYFKLEKSDKVIETCGESLKHSPHNIKSLQLVAASYASKGEFKTAAEYFQKSYDINPTNEEVERSLAITLYNSNQNERAAEIIKKMNTDHPSILKIKEKLGG